MAFIVDEKGNQKAPAPNKPPSSGYTPTSGAKSSSSGTTKSGTASGTKTSQGTTPQGSSYAPSANTVAIRDYVTSQGGTVQWDPSTKTVLINGQRITPATIQNGVSYASKADIDRILNQTKTANNAGTSAGGSGGAAYGVDDMTKSYEGEAKPSSEDLQAQAVLNIDAILSSMNGMLSEVRQSSAEAQAAAAAYMQQMLSMIDNMQQQITAQIQSQMGGNDPGLLAAIGLIREEVARQQQSLLEELNARGVVQSGLYAEMLERLNRNELTQVQQLVGSRLSELQAQLNSAIMNLAQARIQAMSGYHSQMMQIAAQDRSTLAQLGTQLAGLTLQGAGMKLQADQYNRDLQQRYDAMRQQYDIARMQDATQRYGIDVGAETQKYGIDVNNDLQRYLGQLGYNQAIQTANISAAAQRYAADKSADARLRELQMQYELSQRTGQEMSPGDRQELLAMQTTMANVEMENIKKNLKSFRSKAEVEAFIDSMPFMPEVKQYMKAQVRFLNLPDTTPANSGTNNSNNMTYTPVTVPKIPAGTYWTPNTRSYLDLFNSFR